MGFTVKIYDDSPKAKSIINLLKELAEDYSFLTIVEDDKDISENIVKELESRYQYVSKNIEQGKTWDEIKNTLYSKC